MDLKDYKGKIAENIKKYRQKKKMTQQDLSDAFYQISNILVKPSTISAWENKVNSINSDYMPGLAEALDVELEDLYGQENDPKLENHAASYFPFLGENFDEEDLQAMQTFAEFLQWRKKYKKNNS